MLGWLRTSDPIGWLEFIYVWLIAYVIMILLSGLYKPREKRCGGRLEEVIYISRLTDANYFFDWSGVRFDRWIFIYFLFTPINMGRPDNRPA